LDHGEPEIRARDSDEGIWVRAGWSGAKESGPPGGNSERRRLRRMGSGQRSADCCKLFGERLKRQANMQTGFAGNVWAATGASGAPGYRNRVAFRGPEGVRFD